MMQPMGQTYSQFRDEERPLSSSRRDDPLVDRFVDDVSTACDTQQQLVGALHRHIDVEQREKGTNVKCKTNPRTHTFPFFRHVQGK